MSLRTKMVLSIFVFLFLVFGLLTLNLLLDAKARADAEAGRSADLTARVVGDLVRTWTAPFPAWTEDAWAELSRKLALSEMISGWTIVGRKEGGLRVMISSEQEPERILAAEEAKLRTALNEVLVEPGGSRLYVPIQTAQGERFAARLDVRGAAGPGIEIARALKGIMTVMALGTALLLLNTVIFTNRLVLRPLGSLVEASNRVAQGDFTKKIAEGETYDEMGRMIRAFNLMLDKISDYHGRLQKDIQTAQGRIHQTERRLFAAQRLSATGTLAAGIAHEINNPLGVVLMYAHLLAEEASPDAPGREDLELIATEADRCKKIVAGLLHFARQNRVVREPVDVEALVRDTLRALPAPEKVAVEVDCRLADPNADLDRDQIAQVLTNLATNAYAAMPGGGELKVEITGDAEEV
ncbi:MAG: HAMP domain-containing protein, partial [Planctomycetes bacterium]|nr:HAMP domain-containing protein [Planctomycetota bacterium]